MANSQWHSGLLSALATYITSVSSFVLGETLHLERMPEQPERCLALVTAGGMRIQGSPLRVPMVRVLCRAQTPEQGLHDAEAVFGWLDHKANALGATYPCRIIANHEVGPPIYDENNRAVYYLNFTIYAL
jgi:hypothetical protein